MCTFNLSCTCFHLVALVLDNVKIIPDRVKILVGETLVLNCTGETTFNGRLQFDWDFPRTKVRHFFSLFNFKIKSLWTHRTVSIQGAFRVSRMALTLLKSKKAILLRSQWSAALWCCPTSPWKIKAYTPARLRTPQSTGMPLPKSMSTVKFSHFILSLL